MNRVVKYVARQGLFLCLLAALGASTGCAGRATGFTEDLNVRDAIESYRAGHAEQLAVEASRSASAREHARYAWNLPGVVPIGAPPETWDKPRVMSDRPDRAFTLGTYALFEPGAPQTQPTALSAIGTRPTVPEGYWRQDIWHQMGHEALALGGHDFWKGFKTSYWNLPNAALLTATLGASFAIRETGVDDTIAARVKGHRQLGSLDETIQILGHPGTHFAATGVLWLTSALTQDMKEHEVAKSLAQALAVNGVSTLLLKAATNTSSPDGDRFAWPSGHTSSAFTTAAVLNEYYGPWVGIPSLALAGLVGYQRIDSRVHDFSDVVFGAMMGYVIGSSIAHDNKAQFPEIFGMKVLPFTDPETGAAGLALLKQW